MPWQLLLLWPILASAQQQPQQQVQSVQQPLLNNNFGFGFGFPALHGVPQLPVGVQPLQPFGTGLQGFQPTGFSLAQGVPNLQPIPGQVTPLQPLSPHGVAVAQGVQNFSPSVQSAPVGQGPTPQQVPAQTAPPALPVVTAAPVAQAFPQTVGAFPAQGLQGIPQNGGLPTMPTFPGFTPLQGMQGLPTFPQPNFGTAGVGLQGTQTGTGVGVQPVQQPAQPFPGALPGHTFPQATGALGTFPQAGAALPVHQFPHATGGSLPGVQPFPLHPQFNPLFPFSLPGFQLPQHNLGAFPGAVTAAPIYATNQVGTQGTQYQGQIPPTAAVQLPQTAAPTTTPLPPPPQTVPPTVPTTTATTTTPPPAPTTVLPVVDAKSATKSPKRATTSTKRPHIESEEDSEESWDDDLPPLAPTELTEMRDKIEEETVVEETTAEPKKQEEKKDHRSEIRTGSMTPKVLDFRSINPVKTVPVVITKDSMDDQEEKEEVDAILSRVLDAVAPMHQVKTTSTESEFRSRA